MYELNTRALAQLTHVPIYALMAYAILQTLSQTELYERILKARD
jgi:cytochrome b